MADLGGGLLQITPNEKLKFRFELKKQIPTTIRLYNNRDEEVAFKVKTTAPKKYCVKPNTGMVPPHGTTTVDVIMQAQKEYPADMAACKDKFLVLSTLTKGQSDFTELFSKDKGAENIKEAKLRVEYIQPAPPPSPVPEDEEVKAEGNGNEGAPETIGGMAEGSDYQSLYRTTKAELVVAKEEKQAASEDRARLQRELQELTSKLDGTQQDLKMALQGSSSKDSVVRGFSLLHLLITAVLAFLVGHYITLLFPSDAGLPPPETSPDL